MVDVIESVSCTSAQELVAELLPLSGRLWARFREDGTSPEWIFRGQRDASWKLQPSAFRPNPFAQFASPPVDSLPVSDRVYTDEQRLEMHHVIRFVDLAEWLAPFGKPVKRKHF